MIRKVEHFINLHQLIRNDDLVLVALSGGADSVALLCLLSELHCNLQALHCNFHLRGQESDRDERFVTELCRKKGIRLHIKHFNTMEYATRRQISIEMAARQLRYDWFEGMRQQLGASCIAVAHHKDDQAETLLLNLLRGSGLKGLAGMKPRRDFIIRPLLCVTRAEILQYLQAINQNYVTDSTNLERDALRNRIRLDVIPLLKQLNPVATEALARTCQNIQSSLPLYEEGLKQTFHGCHITDAEFPLNPVSEIPGFPTLLHEWLDGKGFTAAQEQEMREIPSDACGKVWESKTYRLLKDRNALLLQSKGQNSVTPVIRQEAVEKMTEQGADIAYIDADLLTGPLEVRKVRPGDWFIPFGMKGRKLVSDFLTDRKTDLFRKESQHVAVSGEDIIWLIGQRSDNRYRVTDHTKHILKLTILKDPE